MNGIVFDVEHFATKDGPGIRTVVFLKGCPLRCKWCSNPESWKREPEPIADGPKGETRTCGRSRTVEDVLEEVLRDAPFYRDSGGGLTLSGGEPLAQAEFAEELMRRARAAGVRTAIETSGYAPQATVEKMAAVTDLWLYDIKGMDPQRHLAHTRVDNAAILRNLRWLDAHGAKIVLRCPMIPGENDFEANLVALGKLADELGGVQAVDVEPYVPYGADKAKKLGMEIYEAKRPAPDYADRIAAALRRLTGKPVRKS